MSTMRQVHPLCWGLALCVALGAWLLMPPLTAQAETITVTSTLDAGADTLRAAIAAANPGATIVFNAALAGKTITLTSQLGIAKNLTIDGSSLSAPITLNGNNVVRVLNISANARVTLAYLRILKGSAGGGFGGGLAIAAGAVVTLTHSSILTNTAYGGGGISNSGVLLVQASTFAGNATATYGSGAGIYNGNTGVLTVANSTFAHNIASYYGGGIYNYNGTVTVMNSTVATNTASTSGGGIYVALGTGAGVLHLRNTLFAGNVYSDCVNSGTILTNDHNLIKTGNCGVTYSGDPRLGPLADNGGATWTFALLPGSPAIDAGNPATCRPTDQRDISRPQGAACDVGAFEVAAPALALAKSVTPMSAPYHGIVTYTLILSNTGAADDTAVILTDTLPSQVDFGAWITRPGGVVHQGNAITWTGALTANTALPFIFTATHRLGVGAPITNTATFRGSRQTGSAAAAFTAACSAALTVGNTNDSGPGSLRQAIADICPGGMIDFASDLTGQTITLTAQLDIAKNLTLDAGSLITPVSLSGNHTVRVLNLRNGAHVTVNHLHILYGINPYGGCLHLDATAALTLTHSAVLSCTASQYGGGIRNWGALTLQQSTLSGNHALYGGGIENRGALTVQDSLLSGNTASYFGGGIANMGTLRVQDSTLISNSVAAATSSTGGGGIANSGILTVVRSTLIGNSASTSSSNNEHFAGGGGIYNGNTLVMQDSTLTGNSATDARYTRAAGGGIFNTEFAMTLTVQNSTFSDNWAEAYSGGLYNSDNDGPIYLHNNLIANSTPQDCFSIAAFTTNDNNWIEDGSCTPAFTGDPALGPLQDNGGGTLTHALLPGSPAIDAGNPASCLTTDQRGIPRPQGPTCDIGAYERAQPNVSIAQTVTPTANVPYHGIVTYSLVLSNTGAADDTNVVLTDTLPGGVAFGGWVARPANTLHTGNAITWTGQVTAAASITLTFTATHTGDYGDVIANTAYVSGTTQTDQAAAAFSVVCTNTLTVQNTHDSGSGSLRQAIAGVCAGGVIDFAGDYAIYLTSTLSINKRLTIDGSAHAITMSGDTGNDGSRNVQVFSIAASDGVTLSHLNIVSGINEKGGGIYNAAGSTLTVLGSTLSDNSADFGGGIYNDYGALTVQTSTLSGNSAAHGGGIYNYDGTLVVQNSTLSGNSAFLNGGGIRHYAGQATLSHVTLHGNLADANNDNAGDGGGIAIAGGAALTLTNTIVAGNDDRSTPGYDDCLNTGTLTSQGYNLVGSGTGCSLSSAGDLTTPPPLLGALADNGGGTLTHALLPGSPAIDAGAPSPRLAADQRGFPRADLRSDIGAFELQYADSDTVIKMGIITDTQASFGPTFISITVTGGNAGTITVTKHLAAPGGRYNTGEITATWYITASHSPFTVTLNLCYTDAEIARVNESRLQAFRWDGLDWTTPISTGLTVYTATNCVQVTGVTQFSAWTLFDTGGTPQEPTAARVVGLTARGFPAFVALLALGGAAMVFRRKRRL